MRMKIIYIIASSLLLASCGLFNKNGEEENSSAKKYSVNSEYLDKSVSPKEDFFMFANGNWIKNNPVPGDESRWSSFNELQESNNDKIIEILKNAADDEEAVKGSTNQLLGDFYKAYMNEDLKTEKTEELLKSVEKLVGQLNDKSQLPSLIARLHIKGINVFFNCRVGQDLKNVDKHRLYVSQAGIGLPNRDYYFEENKEDERQGYMEYLSSLISRTNIAGGIDKYDAAEMIFKVENYLAENMMRPAELRVPENTYNLFNREEFVGKSEAFNFNTYFKQIGIDSFEELVVSQPDFFEGMHKILEEFPLEAIQAYLVGSILNHYAKHLDARFNRLHFNFYGKILSGKKEQKPLEDRVISELTSNALKHELGKAFVKEHFSVDAKEKINDMVDNLLIVYRERIKNLEWMGDETKKEALKKLDAIGRKLGYPEEFLDVSSIRISPEEHVKNVDYCNVFNKKKNLAKLHQEVDRDEWGMPAHMVNAYYNSLMNEIAFPAGIMQKPFFDINAEDALNYGAIGMVIGHEFTHGFDDMGSKFAADGSFTNWWQEDDRLRFEERTNKLGETFAQFCPIDGHCVNPDLTMGENIADLGGITMAYHAYAMTEEYKSGIEVNGFTPSQRFFLAYAQLWKVNYTDEELKKRLATDPHSPGMYRVNGPLMNCPEFFEAFGVEEDDPMRNPEEIISRIW